jgi:hypothetical protein
VKLGDGYIAEIVNIVVFIEMCLDKRDYCRCEGKK